MAAVRAIAGTPICQNWIDIIGRVCDVNCNIPESVGRNLDMEYSAAESYGTLERA